MAPSRPALGFRPHVPESVAGGFVGLYRNVCNREARPGRAAKDLCREPAKENGRRWTSLCRALNIAVHNGRIDGRQTTLQCKLERLLARDGDGTGIVVYFMRRKIIGSCWIDSQGTRAMVLS